MYIYIYIYIIGSRERTSNAALRTSSPRRAFDTVDHEILLKQLESSYSITGVQLNWMRSYTSPTASSQLMFVRRSQLKYGSTVEYIRGL